jgi:hypothetical protein
MTAPICISFLNVEVAFRWSIGMATCDDKYNRKQPCKAPQKLLPYWLWCRNSRMLDALLTCYVALSCHLGQSFFTQPDSASWSADKLSRDILGNGECWSKIPLYLLAWLRDNGRKYWLHPRFVYSPLEVNGYSAPDVFDRSVCFLANPSIGWCGIKSETLSFDGRSVDWFLQILDQKGKPVVVAKRVRSAYSSFWET